MTETLEKALAQVVALTPDKQDTIGNIILEEIKDDELWDKQFKESQSQLSKIAAKVKSDIKAGKIQQKGFAELWFHTLLMTSFDCFLFCQKM